MVEGESYAVRREAITTERLLAVAFEARALGTPASMPATGVSRTQPTGSVVSGRIIEPDGAAVPFAMVGLMGTSDTLTASDSGRFTLRDVPDGAYTLWVRRIGFHEVRLPITVSHGESPAVTITLDRAVPELPTVITTAEVRQGYHNVGLDTRMRTGIGQFVTYDEIVRRQATQVTQLLTGIRGLVVGQVNDGTQHFGTNNTIVPTRGRSGCVEISIDGVSQQQLGDRDLDNLITPAQVGAIEVYTSSERPPGLGGPIIAPNGCEDAMVILIWTRQRLGINPGRARADSTRQSDVSRGLPIRTVSPIDSTPRRAPPRD